MSFSYLSSKIKGTKEIGLVIVMLVRYLLWIAELHDLQICILCWSLISILDYNPEDSFGEEHISGSDWMFSYINESIILIIYVNFL